MIIICYQKSLMTTYKFYFRLHIDLYVFITCVLNFKKGYCVPKKNIFKRCFVKVLCTNINNDEICFDKDNYMYFKAKHFPTHQAIFSLKIKYGFIVFWRKK